jgi:hypothetical protein
VLESIVRRRGLLGRLIVVASLLSGPTACAMHQAAPSAGGADADVISEAEIDSSHAFNAYEVVHKLRPRFLVSRGKLSLDPSVPPALPNVYVDLMYYGDVSALRGISTASLESIRFYSPAEAQYAFGRGNMAGVIGVTTKH